MSVAMTPKAQKLFLAIAVLALAGVVVSSVALRNHYVKDKSSFCDFGESFNCDVVNRSQYSVVVGIPVALIGILGYAALFGLSTFSRGNDETPTLLLAAAAPGLAFALYLTYVEGFILSAWCILCLSSLAFISAITILSVVLLIQSRRDS
jgi:vitamin-K-epoxide reductase (warfarin-sensitive)